MPYSVLGKLSVPSPGFLSTVLLHLDDDLPQFRQIDDRRSAVYVSTLRATMAMESWHCRATDLGTFALQLVSKGIRTMLLSGRDD